MMDLCDELLGSFWENDVKVDGYTVAMTVARFLQVSDFVDKERIAFDLVSAWCPFDNKHGDKKCLICQGLTISPVHHTKESFGLGSVISVLSVPNLGINGSLKLLRPTKVMTTPKLEKYGRFCAWGKHDESIVQLYRRVRSKLSKTKWNVWYHIDQMDHAHVHFASTEKVWSVRGSYKRYSAFELYIMDGFYNIARNICDMNNSQLGEWRAHRILDLPMPLIHDDTIDAECAKILMLHGSLISNLTVPRMRKSNGKYEFPMSYNIRVSKMQTPSCYDVSGKLMIHPMLVKHVPMGDYDKDRLFNPFMIF
jgi:hypothetical protein